MKTVKFQLEPLTCPSCIRKIEGRLGKTKGISTAKVLFQSSKVKAEYDEELISPEKIENIITGLGYPVQDAKVS